jgi:hypothetical protein
MNCLSKNNAVMNIKIIPTVIQTNEDCDEENSVVVISVCC